MFNSSEREQLEVVIEDLVDDCTRLQKLLKEAQTRSDHLANVLNKAEFDEGTWDCGEGKCWYEADDHLWDQCVVCGDPDERK